MDGAARVTGFDVVFGRFEHAAEGIAEPARAVAARPRLHCFAQPFTCFARGAIVSGIRSADRDAEEDGCIFGLPTAGFQNNLHAAAARDLGRAGREFVNERPGRRRRRSERIPETRQRQSEHVRQRDVVRGRQPEHDDQRHHNFVNRAAADGAAKIQSFNFLGRMADQFIDDGRRRFAAGLLDVGAKLHRRGQGVFERRVMMLDITGHAPGSQHVRQRPHDHPQDDHNQRRQRERQQRRAPPDGQLDEDVQQTERQKAHNDYARGAQDAGERQVAPAAALDRFNATGQGNEWFRHENLTPTSKPLAHWGHRTINAQ